MTDVKVTDPHTAARLANGATVQSVLISAENEKHRKYNSGDCLLGQDVKLTPLVFGWPHRHSSRGPLPRPLAGDCLHSCPFQA